MKVKKLISVLTSMSLILGTLCSAVVFAAKEDKTLGRGVYIRMFGGSLTNRAALTLPVGIDPFTVE